MAKILIIEDEEALLLMLAERLERDGYESLTAKDGEEGLLKMKEEKPDLVLLDIVMPKIGGFEVLEAMQQDPALQKIPVIIISNSGQPVEIGRAKTLGVKDYLVKTEFDPEEVVAKVRKILGMSSEDPGGQKEERGANVRGSLRSPRRNPESASGKKVLIVEDDQFLRDLIVRKLEDEGFVIFQAIDGEEGLGILREKKPDLVLLDLILPGMDGFEVLKQAKEDKSVAHIPILILSNLGQRDDVDKGVNLGAADYLIKAHFTPSQVVQEINKLLTK
jgi:DNA-binding response OmpR family regulator